MKNLKINATSANFPGFSYLEAINLANANIKEGILGKISADHMQLCPQNKGQITENFAEKIKNDFAIQFRIHANARLLEHLFFFDTSNDLNEEKTQKYLKKLKKINKIINAPIYSYHAGRNQSWQQAFEQTLKLQDYLKIPVALEGIYPNKHTYAIADLNDYQKFLNNQIFYAIDLSHLNIVWHHNRHNIKFDDFLSLTKQLINNNHCLEIHLSDNNGHDDQHQICLKSNWWLEIIKNLKLNKNCQVFSEGDQRKNKNFNKIIKKVKT